MKLVSIDVGLRNLAVCVLEGTSRHDVKIVHWDVIDVLGEKNGVARPLCFRCSKPAMWKQPIQDQFACSKHCPAKSNITKTALSKKQIPELQCEVEMLRLTPKSKKKPDLVDVLYKHYRSNTWQKFAGHVTHAPVLDLAADIKACLDRRSAWWVGANKVVFENQLDRRMLAVQGMLHMYFVCCGFACSGVSATHKLSNIVTVDDRVTTYRGRKKTGIVHAEALMPPAWSSFFNSHKKKDDLADCFLQGLWILEH
jgi:hypothetical protein